MNRWNSEQFQLINQNNEAYSALLQSEEHLAEAQSLAKIGSWSVVFGRDSTLDTWKISKGLRYIYGYSDDEEIVTQSRFKKIHPEDQELTLGFWEAAKRGGKQTEWDHRIVVNNQTKWVHVVSSFEFDSQGKAIMAKGTTQDITYRKEAENRIGYLASHDKLTELPNRELFYDRLSQAIYIARRKKARLAVLFLDLDGFKPINDKYGHESGDSVLKIFSQRVRDCIREMDTFARMGGDEFAIILSEVVNTGDIQNIAGKIIKKVSAAMLIKGTETCNIGVSIGIATFPDNGTELDNLMMAADNAMYQSKARGKNTYTISTQQYSSNGGSEPWIRLDASCVVGLEIIDQQHQMLVDKLNLINASLKQAQSQEILDKLFDELVSFTDFHFNTEEKLMDQYEFPEAVPHKKAHIRLLEEINQFKAQSIQGRELVILQTLKDWLLIHSSGYDRKLADFIKLHGAK